MIDLTRRNLMSATAAIAVTGCSTFETRSKRGRFFHGVASGDPGQNSIVLWTRVSTSAPSVKVRLEIARDEAFTSVVRELDSRTGPGQDYTIKVVAEHLLPGTTYYYRFSTDDAISPIGRTRTIPAGTNNARFAIVSCANYQRGYFHAYQEISILTDLDAVIHLGDYLYEHGDSHDVSEFTARSHRYHEPAHDCVSLDDYRRRHAQYKSDPSAQAMHAAHPCIVIWDDHETANDAWKGGAQAHDPTIDGTWAARRAAALQAYYEWMPVRDPQRGRAREALFKTYVWPNFLTLTTLESRLFARDKPFGYRELLDIAKTEGSTDRIKSELLGNCSRRLIGDSQLDFVCAAIRKSVENGETWRLIGNQVMMATAVSPNLYNFGSPEQSSGWPNTYAEYSTLDLPYSLDAWGGYPCERERFARRILEAGARDAIILTGDTHQSWMNDLRTSSGEEFGTEIGVTAVSSGHWLDFLGAAKDAYSKVLVEENRDIKYHDAGLRGFCILNLCDNVGYIEHYGVSSTENRDYETVRVAHFMIDQVRGVIRIN